MIYRLITFLVLLAPSFSARGQNELLAYNIAPNLWFCSFEGDDIDKYGNPKKFEGASYLEDAAIEGAVMDCEGRSGELDTTRTNQCWEWADQSLICVGPDSAA